MCTWNVCLGILHKIHLIKRFLIENDINILCVQEAELKEGDNISLINIQGYSLEVEKTSAIFKKRSLIYIKDNIRYQRSSDNERENTHIICIKLVDNNLKLASMYRTYKLTHTVNHKDALAEQIAVLNDFMATGGDTLIMGDINLDYRKRYDPAYHLRPLYEEWSKFEQEQQLLQMVDFTTWQRTNGNNVVQSILDHV